MINYKSLIAGYRKWLLVLLVCALAVSAMIAIVYPKGSRRGTNAKKRPAVIGEADPRLVVQLGHSGAISSAVYSSDGRLIVTGGTTDRVAILWDAATGREIRRFIGHANRINSVAFSPDNRFILTGSGGADYEQPISDIKDYTARLWDVNSGNEVRRFQGHTGSVNSVVFSPDGRFVLTGGDDRTVRLWDANSGKEIKSLSPSMAVKSVAYSPDSQFVLTGGGNWDGTGTENCENCAATLWETKSWKTIRTFGEQIRPIGSVSFSHDGHFALLGTITPDSDLDYMVFGSSDIEPIVSQWDMTAGKKVRDFRGFAPAVFSPDSSFVVTSGARTGGAQVWDAASGKSLYYIEGLSASFSEGERGGVVRVIAISPNKADILVGFDSVLTGGNAITESGGKGIYILASESGKRRFSLMKDTVKPSGSNSISETTSILQIGSDIWDKSSGAKILLKGIDKGKRLSLPQQLSADGTLILSGNGAKITIWDINTGEIVNSFEDNGSHAAWITQNNKYVLFESVESDGFLLRLFDIKTGKLKWNYMLGVFPAQVRTVAIDQDMAFSVLSPDGRFVYALNESDGKSELLIIGVESGNVVNHVQLAVDVSNGIRVSPNGRFLAFSNSLYDVVSNEFLFQDSDSGCCVQKIVTFSPDNKFFAAYIKISRGSVLEHARVQIWSLVVKKKIKELPLRLGNHANLRFSPDSSKLLVSYGNTDSKNAAQLYDITAGTEGFKLEHYDSITSMAFFANNAFISTSSDDGSSRIWDAKTGKELCRLISLQNGDWIVTAPDGRFDTNNLDGIEGLHWVVSSELLRLLPIEIFMRQYYEPRLLARVLAGENFKPLPKLGELNRAQPEVKIVEIKPDSDETVQVTVEASNVKSAAQKDVNGNPAESGVYDIRLFRDGQLVAYAPGDGLEENSGSTWSWLMSFFTSESSPNDGEVELDKDGKALLKFPKIRLPRTGIEQVEFSTYAFNADRVKSETSRKLYAITPKLSPVKGRAYVISLGVNAYDREGLNLRYAANDARQSQSALTERLASRGEYEEVIGVQLVSDYEVTLKDGRVVSAQDATIQHVREGQKRITENRATKAHLRAALDTLAGRQANTALLKDIPNGNKLRAARPEDLVMIVTSSHGYTDSDGVFYLVPSDTGTTDAKSPEFRSRCVSSNDLSRWLRDVDAGELVMIVDACHSAAAIEGTDFKPGPMGSRGLGQLSYDKGMRILTATQADNVALEANKIRQGLLTYALLQDGLSSGLADYKPKDRSIVLAEWLGYGVERVPLLYNEIRGGRIRSTIDPSEVEDDKTQRPSLFDFARRQRDIVLARRP